jgi:hypothetical protein
MFFSILLAITATSRAEVAASEVTQWLQQFDKDPVKQMNAPVKKIRSGTAIPLFSEKQIAGKDFVTAKDLFRQKILNEAERNSPTNTSNLPGRGPILANDLVQNLVDLGVNAKTRISDLDAIRSAETKSQPWTDTYWPIYQGVTGVRYAVDNFPGDWNEGRKEVFEAKHALDLIGENYSSVDQLSPAEKYDLLIGNTECSTQADRDMMSDNDRCFGFTKRNWRVGKYYYDSSGKVESWMGICHGWAPASYMERAPINTITLRNPDGMPIRFYPSDIKALASVIWANAPYNTRFIGGRCNDKDPATDTDSGRITSQNCFDNNPGTFHAAIINQIGISKRAFVFDATYDYEVWNFPVYKFSYRYFNPQTNEETENLDAATIRLKKFNKDKFKKYRSKDAKNVVGVAMTVSYTVETYATQNSINPETHNAVSTSTYLYDLELNSDGIIVGGEWYQNAHPDFLWTPAPTTQAESYFEDGATGSWNGEAPLPESWKTSAQGAVSQNRTGLPLRKILEKILDRSRAPISEITPVTETR